METKSSAEQKNHNIYTKLQKIQGQSAEILKDQENKFQKYQ